MNRTVLASAVIAATTLFASAAQACISCEYVPEVIAQGNRSHSYEASRSAKIRIYTAEKDRRLAAAMERRAAMAAAAKRRAVRPNPPKKIETAMAEPTKAKAAAIETSSIADKPAVAKAEPVSKPISTAALANTGGAHEEPAVVASKDVGCKKFIAAVGTSISVPCK